MQVTQIGEPETSTSKLGRVVMQITQTQYQTDFTVHGKPVMLLKTTSVMQRRTSVKWYVKLESAASWIGTFNSQSQAIDFYKA
jgi:hypothetical protein